MSHDQRPGKVRVIDNSEPIERRDATPAVAEVDAPPARARRISLLAVALFLLACGAGGALTQLVVLR